jgi:hypothetical protein
MASPLLAGNATNASGAVISPQIGTLLIEASGT